MAKMDTKWVVLCSTAVAVVYASGFMTTEGQATTVQPPIHQVATTQPTSQPSRHQTRDGQSNHVQVSNHPSINTQQAGTTHNSSSTQKPASTHQASTTHTATKTVRSKYKDGTYQGVGMNRRGAIQVAVTIKNDKITDVEVSDYEMHYSESDIAGLPQEVLQRQSAEVDNVSGATYSSMAFHDAVQEAISKALNA